MRSKSSGVADVTPAERALSSMSAPLLKLYKSQYVTVLNDAAKNALQSYRDMGDLVRTVTEDPDTFKAGAVELLAAAGGQSASMLYKARAFLDSYTAAEFRELCGMKGPHNLRLGWSHVIHLLSISDKKVRLKFQQQAVDQAWTADQLHAAIMAQYENRRPGSGRKFVKPKTVSQGIQNYCAFTGELIKRTEQVWSETLDELAEIPIESHTPESRDKLLELVRLQGQAIEGLNTQRDKCNKVLEMISKKETKALTKAS